MRCWPALERAGLIGSSAACMLASRASAAQAHRAAPPLPTHGQVPGGLCPSPSSSLLMVWWLASMTLQGGAPARKSAGSAVAS